MKNKEFEANIVITTPGNVTDDQLLDQFIDWIESKGYSCGGGFRDISEPE